MPGPVKHVERSATIAFGGSGAEGKQYLACGTMAGAIDLSFSTSSVLEVYAVDPADTGSSDGFGGSNSMPLVGRAVHAPERFNRLVWSPPETGGSDGMGILAGGLVDGAYPRRGFCRGLFFVRRSRRTDEGSKCKMKS